MRARARAGAMSPAERRAALGLGAIYALRMLGLFLILPVFALYARGLEGYRPELVGIAIGAYGLTQAALQIPFGLLSDRIGRKPVILGGLLVFAAGSVVAALADTMAGVIAGRALQGAGAIAAAVMALAADLTREEHRTKAMAVIGVSIGAAFMAALVGGPVLDAWIGVRGIFWLTAALALAGAAVLLWVVPQPVRSTVHRDAEPVPAQLGAVLRDGQLLRLDVGVLCLHAIQTALFVALPVVLRDGLGIPTARHALLYAVVLAASVALMVPFVILAERGRRMRQVFTGSVAVLALALVGLAEHHGGLLGVGIMLVVYFAAFNVLEATLPSLVSRMAPPHAKGSAMGAFSSSQFLGAFVGGALGGLAFRHWGAEGVFLAGAAVAALWFLVAWSMRAPRYLSSEVVRVRVDGPEAARRLSMRLTAVRGVAEAVVVPEEGVAYLKVDPAALDREALAAAAAEEN